VTNGVIELERSDREGIETYSKYDYVFLPKNTEHQITGKEIPVKLVDHECEIQKTIRGTPPIFSRIRDSYAL